MSTRTQRPDRREFLRSLLGAGLGLTLGERLAAAALLGGEDGTAASARAVILLWMAGGPSQIDTWDPKPGASTGGEFRAIETAVPGIRISEHLPRLAREANDLAILRSMTSREGNHDRARYLAHSGYPPQGPTKHPSLGAVVAKELAESEPELPPFVSLNGPSLGPGILGVDFAPFVIRDPMRPVADLDVPPGVDEKRFARRLALLEALESPFRTSRPAPEVAAHGDMVKKAVDLMRSPSLDALDLTQEKEGLRDAYGRNGFGQGCLMARRLVERGVRYVEAELPGWDTHVDNFATTRELMATLDPAMATLLRDLRERDLLDTTLVLWMGEFGRTPRVNPRGGRDHFPDAWSAVLAGGGVRGGRVVGATDATGETLLERPISIPDLMASVCHALGIDPDGVNVSPLGRPISITDHGRVVDELFA